LPKQRRDVSGGSIRVGKLRPTRAIEIKHGA
jgi:hypothetical protein